MKLIPTREAVGHVLCHDITRIVPGEFKGVAFTKGHVVRPEDVEALLDLGKANLYVWSLTPGMVHEDDAAWRLYRLCAGEHMRPQGPSEGKIDVIAEADGLLTVDVPRLRAVNALGELMVATRPTNTPVKAGDKLAGTRVIPLVVAEDKLKKAQAAAGAAPLLTLTPFQALRAGVITTGSEVFTGRIEDKFTPVLERKMAEYGSEVVEKRKLSDEPEPIARAIRELAGLGCQIVLVTGGMSVDPDDRTPLAIKLSGAEIISYGAPVLPGAMFMLAYLDAVPVVGLPGCVMYARRTIFDLVLPRLAAGRRVDAAELAALGHGGLCLSCEMCTFPNCGFGRGV